MSEVKATATASGGVGFFGILFFVFLVLKLTHVIDWSWWWVTAPLWGGFLLFIIFFAILFLLYYKISNL